MDNLLPHQRFSYFILIIYCKIIFLNLDISHKNQIIYQKVLFLWVVFDLN